MEQNVRSGVLWVVAALLFFAGALRNFLSPPSRSVTSFPMWEAVSLLVGGLLLLAVAWSRFRARS